MLALTGCPSDLGGSTPTPESAPDPTPVPGPFEVSLEWTEHPPCVDPAAPPGRFADGSAASGIDFVHASDPAFVETDDLDTPFAETASAGVAAADLDGDGHVDVFFTSMSGPNALFWGLGEGRFERAEPGVWALPNDLTGTVRAVDVDGDGLLDLDLAGHDSMHVLQNRGDRTFEDVTEALGLVGRDGWPGGAAWGDLDGDGDLDLFAGGYVERALTFPGWTVVPSAHAVWRNDGDHFTDTTESFGFGDPAGATLHVALRDLDGDGDLDVFQVNDFGLQAGTTRPWENLGDGRWRDRLDNSGLGMLHAPMGAAFSDLDADGRADLWLSDLGYTTAFRGFAPFTWTDVSLVWAGDVDDGPLDASWSAIPIDLDGDGRPGVYLGYGQLPAVFRGPETPDDPQPDRFLAPYRTGPKTVAFENLADDVFPAPIGTRSRGAAVADFDRNGVPDLLIGGIRARPTLLYGVCTDAARLVVALHDTTGANPFGVGASVTVASNGVRGEDTITAGGRGSFSSSEPVVFFGLGDGTAAEVSVRWPDGTASVFEEVPAHARVTVTRREAP